MTQGCQRVPVDPVAFNPQPYLDHFARLIIGGRRTMDVTQEDLAGMVNVSLSLIQKFEQGLQFPKMRTFLHICHALEIPFEIIFPANPDDPRCQLMAFLYLQGPEASEALWNVIPAYHPLRKRCLPRRKAVAN